jgi:hypothetical protein
MRLKIVALVVCVGVPVLAGCGATSVSAPSALNAPAPPSPRSDFGAGQYRVGIDIVPGRYFSSTTGGCEWERQSGFSGTPADVIASGYVAFAASQIVVDIAPSDQGFKADSDCGHWSLAPSFSPPASTITPGWWVVGTQMASGTYRAEPVSAGCYWQRLRDFSGMPESVISEEWVNSVRSVIVTVSPGDVGFKADADCGMWAMLP